MQSNILDTQDLLLRPWTSSSLLNLPEQLDEWHKLTMFTNVAL